jgi:RHS repeat-associated protein
VIIATGAKVLPELDFVVPPDDFPLKVSRLYDKNLTRTGIFGPRWSSNLDINLTFEYGSVQCTGSLAGISACNPAGNPLSKIYVNGETGYGSEFTLIGGVWTSSEGETVIQSGTNWIHTTTQGTKTTYDSYGRPLTIRNERGVGLNYAYNGSNQLASVTHSSGRSISFTWSGLKVATVTDPNGSVYGYGYNGSGHLASVVYPSNLGTRTYHYEDSSQPGGLTGISINGTRYSRYSYLANGKVSWSGLEGGAERSTFSYAANYTEVTNALGHTVHYEYAMVAGNRKLIWVESTGTLSCTASIASTTYDVNGNKDIEADYYGVKTDYNFDADGRLIQKISGIGPSGETDQQQITQLVWDPIRKSRLNQIKVFGTSTSLPLSTTTYTYYPDGDARARLLQSISVANLGGGSVGTLTTNYNYTVQSNGLLGSMTVDGPLAGTSDSITSTFDAAGNLLTVKNSLNHTLSYANYNGLGQPGTVTSANGAVSQFTYNARGQKLTDTKIVNGVAQTTTTTYDTRGRPIRVVAPDGYLLDTAYDDFDRATSVFQTNRLPDIGTRDDPDNEYNRSETFKRAVTYNLLSQPLTVITSYTYFGRQWDATRGKPINMGYVDTQQKSTYEYDAGGLLSKQNGEHGQSLTYHYNANGDMDWVQDALAHTTYYAYDRMRRMSSITDAANGVTLIGYNSLGLKTSVRDARNNTTTYAYDGLGNLLSQSSLDTGASSFTYNSIGQLTQKQRADMSTTAYTYDTLGRLKTQASGGQTRLLTYDSCTNGLGQMCSAVKTGGTATTANFTYTPWGQLANRQDVLNGTTDTTSYNYDGMLRLVGISYPSGVSVGYGYYGGQLGSITATVNGATTVVAGIGDYQFLGPSRYLNYGNGLSRQTNFDTDGRVTGISVFGNYPYATQSLTYGFDQADQITAITNGVDANLSQHYAYDNVSRLTGVELAPGVTSSFGYDAVGNRLSASNTSPANSTSYTVAGTGNRMMQSVTGGLTRNYTHNTNGDITAFTNSAGVANTLAYDPFGRLASHTKSGVTTTYTVNALDQRMAKSNSSSNSRYAYAGFNQMLAENTNGAWTSYIWNGGEPVAMVRNNQIYYLHNDHLGRPEAATNSAMATVWKASNLAFDRTVTQDTIGGLNLGFPGQYIDNESGVWHNGYREYLADAGRYLQSDPIGLDGGPNTYAYVGGNPVNAVDPLGLESPQYSLGQTPGNVPWNQRADYIQLSVSLYVFSGSLTLSRSGNLYGSAGISRGYPNPVRGLGVSVNSASLLKQCPTRDQQAAAADKQITGLSYSATAHALIGGGYEYSPGTGGAVLFGFGTGVEVSPGTVGSAPLCRPAGAGE